VTAGSTRSLLGIGSFHLKGNALMLNRRLFIGALALGATLTLSPLASAMSAKTYSPQAFQAAQTAGKPILLHITAPWCPTCRAQKPILSKLEGTAKFNNVVTFNPAWLTRLTTQF
jgi:thioredoxin 1